MKRSCAALLLLTLIVQTQLAAQTLEWVKGIGEGPYSEVGNAIAVDPDGNVVVTGYFSDTVDFDPGTGVFNLISEGNGDIFILKLNANGDFLWARRLGGTDQDIGTGIKIDGDGNIYIAGKFRGMADLDPSTAVFNLISNGMDDICMCKLDNAGNFIWAGSIGGTGNDECGEVFIDTINNIYLTGFFINTVDFDPGPGVSNLSSVESLDAFVVKLNPLCDFVFAKSIGGTSDQNGRGLAVDLDGSIYISGYFNDTTDFDPGAGIFNIASVAQEDGFICKLNSSGDFIWVKTLAGIWTDEISALCIDDYGNVYATGKFHLAAEFDPVATSFMLYSEGEFDIVVLKLDPSGNFIWAKSIGGTEDDQGLSVTVDDYGYTYLAGSFRDAADFDPGSAFHMMTSIGSSDGFVCILDVSGNYVWANQFAGSGLESASCLTFDNVGNLYTTGSFSSATYFNLPAFDTTNSAGGRDIFITKHNFPFSGISEDHIEKGVSCFPNPTNGLTTIAIENFDVTSTNYKLVLYNSVGKLMQQINVTGNRTDVNLSSYENGIYLLSFSDGVTTDVVRISKTN